ncbi:MAG: helix-turn-helix domain-containing protein [Sphingomonas sp.]|nr:helix-turn-helix domain-containing protein [Sphingomonas sp.]
MKMEQITRPAPVRPWGRLLSVVDAAAYLGISASSLREHGPEPKRLGARVLYDIRDLDRWADRLSGEPLDENDEEREAREVERRFLEKRSGRG